MGRQRLLDVGNTPSSDCSRPDIFVTMSPMSTIAKVVATCLGAVILSLLLVGVVSSTLLRHAVQVIPLVIALIAVARRSDWAGYLALPVFLFWFLISFAIWLFLLGIARI